MSKPALGRGLGALLGGNSPAAAPAAVTSPALVLGVADTRDRVQRVGVGRLHPCPLQPRKDFPPDTLRELADSIREQGIVQPLIVRERGGQFEIIAGERRWRASQMAGLKELPVIVREADDRSVLELALIENLQRENLNPIEEAHGYAQLIGQFQLTQDDVAAKVGRSRAAVANALRLLRLPEPVQMSLREGKLSVGHAKVLLGLDQASRQQAAAEKVLRESLSVRQTEKLVARLLSPAAPPPSAAPVPPGGDPHLAAVEAQLRERFGTKVQLHYRLGKGAVEIQFFSDDDLDRILQIAGVTVD